MSDDLLTNIKSRAKVWAAATTRIANRNLGKFRSLITVQSRVEEQGDKIGVVSTATGRTARAYEFGSGIHSRVSKRSPKQLGAKGKILIKPVNKKILAFNWEVANANPDKFIFGDGGRVLLSSVQHPGVAAANDGKGYLAPAANEVRKQIREEIPREVRDAVVGTLRKSFKR